MKTNKDIGSAIKSKLEGWKDSPDTAVWKSIEKKLKKKRRRLLFWYFSFGILAMIVLLLFFRPLIDPNEEHIKPSIIESPNKQPKIENIKDSDKQQIEFQIATGTSSNELINSKNNSELKEDLTRDKQYKENKKEEAALYKQTKKSNTPILEDEKNEKINKDYRFFKDSLAKPFPSDSEKFAVLKANTDTLRNDKKNEKAVDTIRPLKKGKRIESITEKNESQKDSINHKEIKWSINPHFTISKYGAFKAKTSDDITTNYGFLLGYKLSEKAFLRIGLKKLELMHTIKDMENKVDYLEIPFNLKYLISNTKINPFITSGISYYRLQNNKNENITSLDDIEYLEGTISLDFGIGLDYKLVKQLYITIESNFNYQLEPFSTNVDYNPFILSINTGIDYRF